MISKDARREYLTTVYGGECGELLEAAMEIESASGLQEKLYRLGYAMEKTSEGVYFVSSALETHRSQRGMCFDGFIYGYSLSLGLSNEQVEFPGLLLGINAFEQYGEKFRRSDHAVLPYYDVKKGKWGAVGHSRYKKELTWREPVFENLADLAVSYREAFLSHEYYFQGYVVVDFEKMTEKTRKNGFDANWKSSRENLAPVAEMIWNFPIIGTGGNAKLPPVDKFFGPVIRFVSENGDIRTFYEGDGAGLLSSGKGKEK